MSYDVFIRGFRAGAASPDGAAQIRACLRPYIVSGTPGGGFLAIACGDGQADVYLSSDSLMATGVHGAKVWDLLVIAARAANWTILPPNGPACLTDQTQRDHLPEALAHDAVLVTTGEELLTITGS